MLRRVLVAGAALAVLAVFGVASQPAAAGTCAVLTERAIGLKQSEAADRVRKQLNRKISRWADKNGIKKPSVVKKSLNCTQKGSIATCTATAKVCG